jgi:(2R)-ethylmalonyl-CoA mutase
VIGAITSIIGMSVLSGSHIELTRQLLETLASSGASDIPVIVGGIIPPQDIQVLRDMGVKQVFTPADYDVISVFERIIDVLESRP